MTRSRAFAFLCLLFVFSSYTAIAQVVPSRTFAPYLDMSKMAARLPSIQIETGVKAMTLAFVVAGNGCVPVWLGGSPVASDTSIAAAIQQVRAKGADVLVAFGGYDGIELAQSCPDVASLQAAYQTVVDK